MSSGRHPAPRLHITLNGQILPKRSPVPNNFQIALGGKGLGNITHIFFYKLTWAIWTLLALLSRSVHLAETADMWFFCHSTSSESEFNSCSRLATSFVFSSSCPRREPASVLLLLLLNSSFRAWISWSFFPSLFLYSSVSVSRASIFYMKYKQAFNRGEKGQFPNYKCLIE